MDRAPIVNIEQELYSLRTNQDSLFRQLRALEELVDVLATPPWKRVWFFLCGWRLYRVGRWYPSKKYPDLHSWE